MLEALESMMATLDKKTNVCYSLDLHRPYESLILTFVTSPYPEMSVPPKANKPWLAICMLHATTAQKATTITVEVNGRPFRTLVAWYSLSMVTLA